MLWFPGPLLKEMVGHFQAKRSGSLSPDRKVWFYSAHDATISAFLNTLKVFDIHFPPFSACVIVELRKKSEEYFVTVRNSLIYFNFKFINLSDHKSLLLFRMSVLCNGNDTEEKNVIFQSVV